MKTLNQKAIAEKYDEISNLVTRNERIALLNKQSKEMQAALWQENIIRKANGKEWSAEQKEIIDTIRRKFMTVESRESVRGGNEADAGQEYHEIMGKASQLLGTQMMGELFGIIGDSKTMKC